MLTIIRRPVHLERLEEVGVLLQVIERTGAKLVVLDTWHRMAGRAEENSNTEQGDPIDIALALCDDYQATVLILDHTGHAQLHARGASAKEDDVDASWLIRLGKGDAEDEDRSIRTARTLVHRKAKDEETREPQRLRLLIDDQREAVVIVDPLQPAAPPKLGRPVKVDPEQAVEELIKALDDADVSIGKGEGPVREWITRNRPGENVPRTVVRSAIALRRERWEKKAREKRARKKGSGS
jgi:hypothetical protein